LRNNGVDITREPGTGVLINFQIASGTKGDTLLLEDLAASIDDPKKTDFSLACAYETKRSSLRAKAIACCQILPVMMLSWKKLAKNSRTKWSSNL
jgi:hypothetical protein